MSNPTSNFGWQMPTATDLVTDLPADFEVFGQAVDTALMDLKGGTTGQVLKKNSGTDMDFVWAADAAGMTNPMTTTGDIIYSSSGSTPARLGIGTTGQVLNVAAGVPAWTTPASGGKVLQVVQGTVAVSNSTTSSGFVDSGLTATITPTSASSKIYATVSMPSGGVYKSASSTVAFGTYKLMRGATDLTEAPCGLLNYATSAGLSLSPNPSFTYLDSPATTSATTYKVQFKGQGGTTTIYTHDGTTGISAIVLMEIGA